MKHLKNQDSPFINALTTGKWVILDGIESAQPELFERLISLCDISNKNLNLFEKGPEYEYTLNNDNPKFKIHENFRLFITYNPIEIEHSKKLTSNFISKCLTFFLSPIDKDDKSSALILSGLFNYNMNTAQRLYDSGFNTITGAQQLNPFKYYSVFRHRKPTFIKL